MGTGITILVVAAALIIGFFSGTRYAYRDSTKMVLKTHDDVEEMIQKLAPNAQAAARWAALEFMSRMTGRTYPEILAQDHYDSIEKIPDTVED